MKASHCIAIHQAALWFLVPLRPLSSRFIAGFSDFCVCEQNLRLRTLMPDAAAGGGKAGYKWLHTSAYPFQ
jgi:hypothetical protein